MIKATEHVTHYLSRWRTNCFLWLRVCLLSYYIQKWYLFSTENFSSIPTPSRRCWNLPVYTEIFSSLWNASVGRCHLAWNFLIKHGYFCTQSLMLWNVFRVLAETYLRLLTIQLDWMTILIIIEQLIDQYLEINHWTRRQFGRSNFQVFRSPGIWFRSHGPR